jgi:hypothetical protein
LEHHKEFFTKMREEQSPPADVLDFYRGMRFIRGYNAETIARKRQEFSVEAKRMAEIAQREIDDASPPDSPRAA